MAKSLDEDVAEWRLDGKQVEMMKKEMRARVRGLSAIGCGTILA